MPRSPLLKPATAAVPLSLLLGITSLVTRPIALDPAIADATFVQRAAPAPAATAAGDTVAPRAEKSVRFAVIGDTGTGSKAQYEVGERMAASQKVFPFEFVLMVGDNIYGSERPQDFVKKFEAPYKTLLDLKIPFYASLGNHDDPNQIFYKPFNMNGERFYTFEKGGARFYALDSNYMDKTQLTWLERELAATNKWKIAFFHHPLYSSGAKHGSEVDLRTLVEPLFIKHRVSVVFAGHEHFYERVKPQNGIAHFTEGGSAKLREGNIRVGPLTAKGFDTDLSYMLIEIADDTLHFQTLSRQGQEVDAGTFTVRPPVPPPPSEGGAQ
jgi:calcineurin-like phosphoesterase family protein